jgi:Family of unknown function (DUF695)
MNEEPFVATYATAVAKHPSSERVILFRYAETFREDFNRKSQAFVLSLIWRYEGVNGMPVSPDREMQDEFEETICTALNAVAGSTLALVVTGDDLKEWTFYAESIDLFMDTLNEALAGKPIVPIEIHNDEDPEWTVYTRFLAGLKSK